MKIAVIGSGVSGLVAAYRLGATHDVTLFESASRLGGHAHTVDVPEADQTVAVDTGFLVCNRNTYPNFLALLSELDVPLVESDMSLSVRSQQRDFEYCGRDLSSLYIQRKHVVSPRFHRMVWDILRFYREAQELLTTDDDIALSDWLAARGFSPQFMTDHLEPMIRAVWSARRDVAQEFPARFLVRFFQNHGFLTTGQTPPWLTIPGGSRTYVDAIARRFRGRILLNARVTRVVRLGSPTASGGALVQTADGETERFDHVVLACHSNQALALLGDPSPLEQEVLGAFPYQPNEAILHTDESVMPRNRGAWASWNVHLDDENADGACLTYWINSLQPLPTKTNFFVSLNYKQAIDPAKRIRTFNYDHPVFTVDGINKQSRHSELINHRSTSYCGAYWRNGFHEDGVVSALRVCESLGVETMARAA